MRRFILFHGKRHPDQMGGPEIGEFLSHLAVQGGVSASTQNQALSAILFLYKRVLKRDVSGLGEVVRASGRRQLPVVLSRDEVRAVLAELQGTHGLIATLLYGSGLRLLECLSLRVKDLGFERSQVCVRQGKGRRQRVTSLPRRLEATLRSHLQDVRRIHTRDLARGAVTPLPGALARKYPNAGREWIWQWVFPAARLSRDRRSRAPFRWHLHETALQRAVKAAAARSGVQKRVTCHTFRHCFATHLLEDGTDIRTVQELLGHRELKTTMIYTHVLNHGPLGVRSPADRL